MTNHASCPSESCNNQCSDPGVSVRGRPRGHLRQQKNILRMPMRTDPKYMHPQFGSRVQPDPRDPAVPGDVCRQRHRHRNPDSKIRPGGQERRPDTEGKRTKTTKTNGNLGTLPRDKWVLYQRPYRTMGTGYPGITWPKACPDVGYSRCRHSRPDLSLRPWSEGMGG